MSGAIFQPPLFFVVIDKDVLCTLWAGLWPWCLCRNNSIPASRTCPSEWFNKSIINSRVKHSIHISILPFPIHPQAQSSRSLTHSKYLWTVSSRSIPIISSPSCPLLMFKNWRDVMPQMGGERRTIDALMEGVKEEKTRFDRSISAFLAMCRYFSSHRSSLTRYMKYIYRFFGRFSFLSCGGGSWRSFIRRVPFLISGLSNHWLHPSSTLTFNPVSPSSSLDGTILISPSSKSFSVEEYKSSPFCTDNTLWPCPSTSSMMSLPREYGHHVCRGDLTVPKILAHNRAPKFLALKCPYLTLVQGRSVRLNCVIETAMVSFEFCLGMGWSRTVRVSTQEFLDHKSLGIPREGQNGLLVSSPAMGICEVLPSHVELLHRRFCGHFSLGVLFCNCLFFIGRKLPCQLLSHLLLGEPFFAPVEAGWSDFSVGEGVLCSANNLYRPSWGTAYLFGSTFFFYHWDLEGDHSPFLLESTSSPLRPSIRYIDFFLQHTLRRGACLVHGFRHFFEYDAELDSVASKGSREDYACRFIITSICTVAADWQGRKLGERSKN